MRYLFGFLCVCAMAVAPLVGCSETSPNLCEGVECEDDDNECTEDVCNPADGTCYVPIANGAVCSGGACLDEVCTFLGTVSGIVYLNDVETPAEVSARVSVLGTSLSTWGEIELHTVLPTGPTDLYFSVFSDALIAELAEMLMIDVDDTKGWVWLSFDLPSGEGGETATLSVPYVGAWTWDADDNLVLSDELLPGVAEDLTFFSVGLTDELTVMPMGVDGVNTCELRYPDVVLPVMAKFLTSVAIGCIPL